MGLPRGPQSLSLGAPAQVHLYNLQREGILSGETAVFPYSSLCHPGHPQDHAHHPLSGLPGARTQRFKVRGGGPPPPPAEVFLHAW